MAHSFDHEEYALNHNTTGPVSPAAMNPFTKSSQPFLRGPLKRVTSPCVRPSPKHLSPQNSLQVLILYNPCAGGGKSIPIVCNIVVPLLHTANISTIIYPSRAPGDLTHYLRDQSTEILSYKADAFVVVGGDGTMHEFANGYVLGGYKAHKMAAILLNGGSGNSLAFSINGFNDGDDKLRRYLAHIIQHSTDNELVQWMDVIEMSDARGVVKYCASQSYFGIPSAAVQWANWSVFKKVFGTLSLRYDIGAVIEMSKHREYRLKFTLFGLQKQRDRNRGKNGHGDGEPFELVTRVEMFVAMKGKYFGKGVCITPIAKLDNGLLDVVILERQTSRLTLIGYFLLLQKIKQSMGVMMEPGIRYYRCEELLVQLLDDKGGVVTDAETLKAMRLPDVGGDGEIGPCLPLRLKALGKAIPVIFPRHKLF